MCGIDHASREYPTVRFLDIVLAFPVSLISNNYAHEHSSTAYLPTANVPHDRLSLPLNFTSQAQFLKHKTPMKTRRSLLRHNILGPLPTTTISVVATSSRHIDERICPGGPCSSLVVSGQSWGFIPRYVLPGMIHLRNLSLV